MDIGEILSKSWKTIWKHKVLWLFGILAGCGATSGGGNGSGSASTHIQNSSQSGTWDAPSFLSPATQRSFEDFFRMLGDVGVWVWILIAVIVLVCVILFSLLFLFASTLGTAGVIKGTSLSDQAAEDEKPLSFGAIFNGLKPHYWKVFLFNLGYRVAGSLLTFILIVPIIIVGACTCGLGFFLLIPIGWFLSVMVFFTAIAIIEESLGIFKAIARAWKVIIKHLGSVVLMFLILGIGQLVLSLLISLPLAISFIPFLINLMVTGVRNLAPGTVISAILFLSSLPLMIILNGILRAYVLSSWTLTFRRLTAGDELEPIVLSEETKK